MIATILAFGGKFILAPVARLWAWLTAEPTRLAFAALIVVCGVLCWRLAAIDGERDKWRDRVAAYEAASKAVKDADVKADAAAIATATETAKGIDDGNERAKTAAAGSDDPLGAGMRSLRAENAGGRGKATP